MSKKRNRYTPEFKSKVALAGLKNEETISELAVRFGLHQRIVAFYHNVFTVVPKGKIRNVARMLRAIHASQAKQAAWEKAEAVIKELTSHKLVQAGKVVREGIADTITCYDFPDAHWRRIRTNNPLVRILREVRRRTRLVGAFPDGNSALILVAARLHRIAGTRWGTRCYLNMQLLTELEREVELAA
jgi:putative transposase